MQRGLRRIAQAQVRMCACSSWMHVLRWNGCLYRRQCTVCMPFSMPVAEGTPRQTSAVCPAFLTLLNSRLVPEGECRSLLIMSRISTGSSRKSRRRVLQRNGRRLHRASAPNTSANGARPDSRNFMSCVYKDDPCARPLTEDVTLQIHRVAHFDATHFQPGTVHGAISVTCKEFLYDPRRQKGMLWVFVTEEGLTQDFWIEIVHRDTDWAIRPARGCGIVPTVGVQCALDLVRDTAQQTVQRTAPHTTSIAQGKEGSAMESPNPQACAPSCTMASLTTSNRPCPWIWHRYTASPTSSRP